MSASAVPTVAEEYTSQLREKILFSLSVYQYVSPSMLHVALGTSSPSALWRQILTDLIAEGLVQETRIMLTTPSERNQTYAVLHLSSNSYTPPSDASVAN